MKQSRLTNAELEWVEQLNDILSSCPSERLGFYTIGDRDITVYDKNKELQINAMADDVYHNHEFHHCVSVNKAHLGTICFPSDVHATTG